MKSEKIIYVFLAIFVGIALVGAASYTFKQNEDVNFRFRCFDLNNSYCSSATSLIISIEYPTGSNALDNVSMTWNPTYYNVSLPTSLLGIYSAMILSPTTNGTVSEFTYEVTGSGFVSTLGFFFLFIVIVTLIFALGIKLKNAYIMMLGSILVLILGFYIIINGLDFLKDTRTTWAIGLVVLFSGVYFMYLSVAEQLKEWG